MTYLIFILGFIFGAILQFAKLNRYDTISGMAMLKDLTVAKAIAVAIGTGAILFAIESGLGIMTFHIKPFIITGVIIGGLIFGAGMAILGYCPGTMAVSLGEGSMDALTGIIGGLFGGFVFTYLFPSIQNFLGPNLGTISLHSLLSEHKLIYFLLVLIIGGLFIYLAFSLHKLEKAKNFKWLYAGIALAILDAVVMATAVADRPIGASTSYPYVGDLVFNNTHSIYFAKVKGAGHWEAIFLGGAFVSGFILSLFRKDFKLTLMHKNWLKYKGNNTFGRIAWAFTGGFILIFGARMAGGCTSGHILSGGMQLAVSSLVFAIFAFTGLLITGKLFYRKKVD
jgi:uncharacterized protein